MIHTRWKSPSLSRQSLNRTAPRFGLTYPATRWLANDNASGDEFCYSSLGTPDAWYDSSLGLNNDAESLTLGHTSESGTTVIDTVSWTSGWASAAGVAMGLGSTSEISADANDAEEAWCAQSSALGSSGDLGTPGEPNDPC